MKRILYLFLSMICILPLCLSSQVLLDYWDFNTATDGDGLLDVANAGTLGTAWNFNTKNQGDVVQGGILKITGDETLTRKVELAPAADLSTLGTKFRFEVNFSSWDLTNMDVLDKFSVKMNDSAGETFANITLEKDSATTARIRFSTFLDDKNLFYRNLAVDLVNTNAKNYAIEFIDGGLVKYFDGGSEFISSSSIIGSSDYAEIIFVKQFTGDNGMVVGIDSFGFSEIPEPRTHALWMGSISLLLLAVRRASKIQKRIIK